MVMDSTYESDSSSTNRMGGCSASVTRSPPFITPPLPAPISQTSDSIPAGGIVTQTASLRMPPLQAPTQTIGITGGFMPRAPRVTMPISPPPSFIPTRQAPLPPATISQSISGDENPHKEPLREQIPCSCCKEYRIDCHGPEIKLDGHCSNCHENGKRCEFESRASDQNLNAPSSSPSPQSLAINGEMLNPIASTNNDNPTNIDNPNPQPDISSSGRQIDQKRPIIDESRKRETSNTIDGITNDHSISSEPRIRPWWKRLFSRIFFSRKEKVQSASDDHEDDLP